MDIARHMNAQGGSLDVIDSPFAHFSHRSIASSDSRHATKDTVSTMGQTLRRRSAPSIHASAVTRRSSSSDSRMSCGKSCWLVFST